MQQQLIEFITHHWALCLTLGVLIIALIYIEMQTKILGAKGVKPQSLIRLLNDGKVMVVDLRDQEAYLGGHILGSINIPLQDFSSDFSASIKRLEEYKGKQIILVDVGTVGTQLLALIKKLKGAGIDNIDILSGGILAWKEERLPLTKNQ